MPKGLEKQSVKTAGASPRKPAGKRARAPAPSAQAAERAAEAAEARIGLQLRHYRLMAKLKLRELAERAGCSESLLSRIENNQLNPSFTMLHRLCKALDISVSKLMSSGVDAQSFIFHAGSRPVVGRVGLHSTENSEAEMFIPFAEGRLLEGMVMVLHPGGHSNGFLTHRGEETGYVIEGRLKLKLDQEVHLLGPGSTFFFRSDIPHEYSNPGKVTTRVVWVNTPPSF
jgi:transcriptional regulator with XRE-family HTH domain